MSIEKTADSFESTRRLDSIGRRTSTLCAVHCAAMPMIASSLPLVGLGWLNSPVVEAFLIGTALILASTALGRGYLRHHRRLPAIAIGVAGTLAIVSARVFLPEGAEAIAMVTGGVMLATAHWVNSRLCAECCRTTHAG